MTVAVPAGQPGQFDVTMPAKPFAMAAKKEAYTETELLEYQTQDLVDQQDEQQEWATK